MATQYEVEHNITTPSNAPRRRRQVDMSTFNSHLHQITPDSSSTGTSTSASTTTQHHNHNPHAVPNPVDVAALFRLLQDQMGTLATTAPTPENRDFLRELVEALEEDVAHPPVQIPGVSQEFIDSLERVPRKALKPDETCPICAEKFLDDPYPLVVQLPCHQSHRFDLECVGPWLRSKGTCPLCRKDLAKKKEEVVEHDEENEDPDGLYA
ncbi:hypothetical protein QBC46DRAFT_382188 [Diplogelasinospora grovesii]|uniref:RING-type domain-containing protein n=1 Tax=Diplogelasinospora grovesii TaxID=303347 RepID=A0AAN6S5Y4_9PEZI|nr:hypothetical protein QBC46DRAFT_382188 [Diplogelasinospora grovesii]